jgi:hypothetical protein
MHDGIVEQEEDNYEFSCIQISSDGIQGNIKLPSRRRKSSTIIHAQFLISTLSSHMASSQPSHLLTISVTLISLPRLLLLSLLLCLTQANFGPESLTLSISKGAEEP